MRKALITIRCRAYVAISPMEGCDRNGQWRCSMFKCQNVEVIVTLNVDDSAWSKNSNKIDASNKSPKALKLAFLSDHIFSPENKKSCTVIVSGEEVRAINFMSDSA